MPTLGSAIAITAEAFKDKTDRGGKPYILHCLHVMNKLKYETDEDLMIIGVLHDLVEDTHYTLLQLEKLGFSNRVIIGLKFLTHYSQDSYEDYIENMIHNQDAIKVKLQDLRHNSDITRIKGVRPKDLERIEKYHNAYTYLKSCLIN